MASITLLTQTCLPHKNPNHFNPKNCIHNFTTCSSYSFPVKVTSFNLSNIRLTSCNCTSALSSLTLKPNWVIREKEKGVYVVVNFYQFVFIEDPEDEVSKHLEFLQVPFFYSS